jgi:hypothetical protein
MVWVLAGLLAVLLATPPYLLVCIDRARYHHMQEIAVAIYRYRDAHGHLPRSAADMINDEAFPRKSEIYSCPLRHCRFFLLPAVPIEKMEYQLLFSDTNVVIRFDPAVRAFVGRAVRAQDLPNLEITIGLREGAVHTKEPTL